jgi:hypothetical protein
MMTEKEKAIELVDKFIPETLMFDANYSNDGWYEQPEQAKQCALICVDEIKNSIRTLEDYKPALIYFDKVKEQIKLL